MPSMPYSFDSDGVEIAYLDEGEGEPIFLVHGFASNAGTNWVFPGWVKTLKEAGYRVIAHDNRGHGNSEKLYESEQYTSMIMAEDVRRLASHYRARRNRQMQDVCDGVRFRPRRPCRRGHPANRFLSCELCRLVHRFCVAASRRENLLSSFLLLLRMTANVVADGH